MSNTPTDLELTTLLCAHWPAETNDWASHMDFARAVLAKWGQPAQAAEPVAREPLTDEQIRAMLNKHPPEDVCGWSYRMGIDDAELHHGIKGGQQ